MNLEDNALQTYKSYHRNVDRCENPNPLLPFDYPILNIAIGLTRVVNKASIVASYARIYIQPISQTQEVDILRFIQLFEAPIFLVSVDHFSHVFNDESIALNVFQCEKTPAFEFEMLQLNL